MTREELLRILNFTDSMNELSGERTELSSNDARWNIISYAMKRHLEGKLLTITSAASAANTPYGTAMRRIDELFEEGYLMKRPRSKTGKSFSLHPTRKLIQEYESYAMQVKAMVGKTFGFQNEKGEAVDYYFGGSYMASRILSYPIAMRNGVGYDRPFRILSPIDPTFRMLNDFSQTLSELCGTTIEIENMPLDHLREHILEEAKKPESKYDLFAVDFPWLGELAEAKVIAPLDDIMSAGHYHSTDFHDAAWKGSSWKGVQYGLPIQPTVELLYCRKDIFDEAGLELPKTTDDVLNAAKALNRSSFNLSGIVMNFGRGTPVAHTFIQTMADFGQPMIALDPIGSDFNIEEIGPENLRPCFDTDAARETAEFLLELLPHAHKDSMQCNWDKRISIFSNGLAAMSYGWSVRAAAFEANSDVLAHGKVAFLPHPSAPGRTPVSPIGGFLLAIPSNTTTAKQKSAWRIMEYLTRPELLKWYVQNGSITSPRYSTSADPEVRAVSPMIKTIDTLQRNGQIQSWPRPAIPAFSDILGILGDEIYFMLQGEHSISQALSNSQHRVDSMMRERGYY